MWKHPPEHLKPPTSISVDPYKKHWRHRNICTTRRLIFQNFEEQTMDARGKACAPGTPCGTELRDGT